MANNDHRILLLTGSSFGLLYVYFFGLIPLYFSAILFLQTIFSTWFWSNPVKHKGDIVHIIDGALARIFIASIIIYKVCFNQKHLAVFATITALGLYFFWVSYRYSSKKWCSQQHLAYHALAHICSAGSVFTAFV